MSLSSIWNRLQRFYRLPAQIELLQEAVGRVESRLIQHQSSESFTALSPDNYEFKVYSQWGEDGIIDHLVRSIPINNKSFVEFGVETYVEANTLFLLKQRNWRGLVIDGSQANIQAIKRSSTYWKYDLQAICAFIDKDNINHLIQSYGLYGDIGILSVDVDGNDYWIWQAIDCISPRIVIAEYNSVFGPVSPLSVPYDPCFVRTLKHQSKLYYGASISALSYLAKEKGYCLVAGNSAGNNVFFVRSDCMAGLSTLSPQEAYVQAGFRESVDTKGEVIYTSFKERQEAIASLPLINVTTSSFTTLADHLA
jgi:hypothetical protein